MTARYYSTGLRFNGKRSSLVHVAQANDLIVRVERQAFTEGEQAATKRAERSARTILDMLEAEGVGLTSYQALAIIAAIKHNHEIGSAP